MKSGFQTAHSCTSTNTWNSKKDTRRYKYAYHYQRADETVIFRYDNTRHFSNLPTAPHHKHIGETEVIAANAPDLQSVLKEIEAIIGA
ncbi:MAG: toxin-antitoxin system TumE family protein [Chloroflexota bacterium]